MSEPDLKAESETHLIPLRREILLADRAAAAAERVAAAAEREQAERLAAWTIVYITYLATI